jgi:hypothetical protein
MTADRDTVLIETVRTHRTRLLAALRYGEQAGRRDIVDNLRRLAVGVVVAAVGCVGCVGYAVVSTYLASRGGSGR